MILKQGRNSFDMFALVVGALAAVAVAIVVLAITMPDLSLRMFATDTEDHRVDVEDRISPLSQVYLPGEEHGAPEPVIAAAEPVAPVATLLTGPQVYNEACIACHGSGIGGAPTISDAAAWAPRIAQGISILRERAITGFQGSTGFMPPKGARVDLSDQEINDAVDYMVAEVQK
jgi:cytochrome c5